jgi:TolB-like protein
MDFGSINSVAVMPFSNLSRDTLAAERVRDVFSTMLLSTGAIYVVPNGEVARALAKNAVATPTAPNVDDALKLGTSLKVEAIITGVVKEYGEVRSGNATGNVVSVSVQLIETTTGKVVWSASSTKGGVTFADRLLGGGGTPLNDVTELAVDELIEKLFK